MNIGNLEGNPVYNPTPTPTPHPPFSLYPFPTDYGMLIVTCIEERETPAGISALINARIEIERLISLRSLGNPRINNILQNVAQFLYAWTETPLTLTVPSQWLDAPMQSRMDTPDDTTIY